MATDNYHPLIQKLFDEYDYVEIDADNHDEFVDRPGITVLFFAGDPEQHREATDVAVVLPELVKAFGGRLQPGVVADFRGAGMALQRRYGFKAWPTLVFLREGGYLGAISRVQNWTDYLQSAAEILKREPSRAPGFEIPVVVSTELH